MFLQIVTLPLISSMLNGFAGRFFGVLGSSIIAIFCLGLSFVLLGIDFIFNFNSLLNQTQEITLIYWTFSQTTTPSFSFLIDSLTYIMCFVVIFVALIVHIYSTQYLEKDPHLPRFLSYLSLFTFFMLILISAENLIQLFLGWEGVGICSYLLINFWYSRIQANKAALKAVFANKLGDISLLIGISLCFYLFHSCDFAIIFSLLPYLKETTITFFNFQINIIECTSLFFLIAAIGKSAQLGLHIWLPDAMEGPTPVSALLHAATMVTAGVFLLIRNNFFFSFAPKTLILIILIGSLTAFFAATTGLLQNDLKRIIAFSTCSQLGYMFTACGLLQPSLALFHLFNHAFFKALLFLAAGSIIHALSDEQDIRKMGGLAAILPLTFSFFMIASASLAGIPFLSGFYSKDLIIEFSYTSSDNLVKLFSFFFLVSAALFTAIYSFRLIYTVFFSRPNFFRFNLENITDANLITQIPLCFLALLSIFSGYLFSDFFTGVGTSFYLNSINPSFFYVIDQEYVPLSIKILPLIVIFVGPLVYFLLLKHPYFTTLLYLSNNIFYYVFCFLNQKWFFDKIYNKLSLTLFQNFYFSFYQYFDKGVLELFGPQYFYRLNFFISQKILNLHQGHLSLYIGFILTIFYLLLFVLYFFF